MAPTLRTRRDFSALEARRQHAARLFAAGQRQADVVHQLRVSRETASRWYAAWRTHGAAGLRGAGRAGRKPRLDAAALARLEAALVRGPTAWGFPTHLWTLQRIALVIWKVCHVRYSVPQAWRVVHQLGWSRQRPTRQARERDPIAVAHWMRTTWPRVKKTPTA
ncbi:MAG: winged helix-turn-helix domain-containing protein [bacterium]